MVKNTRKHNKLANVQKLEFTSRQRRRIKISSSSARFTPLHGIFSLRVNLRPVDVDFSLFSSRTTLRHDLIRVLVARKKPCLFRRFRFRKVAKRRIDFYRSIPHGLKAETGPLKVAPPQETWLEEQLLPSCTLTSGGPNVFKCFL